MPRKSPDDRLRQWLDSPPERDLRERARRLGIKVDLSPPSPRKRRRAKGGGARPKLTPAQIARGKELLRRVLETDTTVAKHAAAIALLRSALKLTKEDAGDGILKAHIIRPVLRQK